MKLTNNYDLPQPILTAVANDEYDNGGANISASSLLEPPRIYALRHAHEDDLTEDVSERIAALLGSAIHDLLEKNDSTGITEKRLFANVDGWKVSGKFDRFAYHNNELQDYKSTKVSSFQIKQSQNFHEWETQLNVYKRLMELNHKTVDSITAVVVLVDWSLIRRAHSIDYPQVPIIKVPLNVWPTEKIDAFIKERVALFKAALEELPQCSDEDRWKRISQWKAVKKGKVRAAKVFSTVDEANAWLADQSDRDQFTIKFTEAEPIRCQYYCPVSKFCDQWAKDPFNPEVLARDFIPNATD